MSGKRIAALGIFILSSLLYLKSTCPAVYTMDNGELIVAADKLLIAHPTGYPLFCILAKLATFIIPAATVAAKINAFNAIVAAMAVSVLFLAVSEIASKRASAFAALLFCSVSHLL